MPASSSRLRRPANLLCLLGLFVVLAFLLHLGVGSYEWYKPWVVVRELIRGPMPHPTAVNTIVWLIRLPRAEACLLVGALLGAVGSAFQALFRNPLAEPYVVGVSSGAAIGGALALVIGAGSLFGGLGTTVFGFGTGLLSLWLVYALAYRRGVLEVSTLLLAGVVMGSMLSAVLSFILYAAGKDTGQILGFLLGNTSFASSQKNVLLLVLLILGMFVLMGQSRRLNAFAIGDDTAQRLGINVKRMARLVLITCTAMTAAAVGAVGIIGFLGLVAPHVSRRVIGVDWRWSLPGSALLGSLLLLFSDLVAQRGFSIITGRPGEEIPVGIVTAILGAPVLLVLLRRR